MGTINMFQVLLTSPKNSFSPLFLSFPSYPVLYLPPPWLSSVTPSVTFPSSRLCSPPPGRTGQPVSHPGPPVPGFAERHLGSVSPRQPGTAGTLGAAKTFSGEIQSATRRTFSHFISTIQCNRFTFPWRLFLKWSWCPGCLFPHQLMFSRPYSRKLEAEADQVGLQLAAKVSFSQFDTA